MNKPITVRFRPSGGGYTATRSGKSSPILRLVPDNTAPAHAAWWPTKQAALEELTTIFGEPVFEIEPEMAP